MSKLVVDEEILKILNNFEGVFCPTSLLTPGSELHNKFEGICEKWGESDKWCIDCNRLFITEHLVKIKED